MTVPSEDPSAPAASASASAPATARPSRRPRRGLVIAVVIVALIALAFAAVWLMGRGRESTDDAFVAADVYTINARVAGRLRDVPVRENDHVEAGQLLAVVESADYDTRIAQRRAAVALTTAQLHEAQLDVELTATTSARTVELRGAEAAAAEAVLQQRQASQTSARTEAERANAEAERYQQLSERAVARQKLQDVQAAKTFADAALNAATQSVTSATAELAAARAQRAVAEAEQQRVAALRAVVERRTAELQQAEAELHQAELDLGYTRITAPASGRVTRKTVLPGTHVEEGQTLMALVGDVVWVVANFKETQLVDLRPGQPASVYIDAYGIDLDAKVDSIQAGSGAAFSLLPPENATGNYVKVVQRVPVKLVFDVQPDPQRYRLGPGMSVVPTVTVR